MSRQLRVEFPGALYHVTHRGNNKRDIFTSAQYDRFNFLMFLAQTCKLYGWRCHAYCLMNNHYHLLIETPEPNLSLGMRNLDSQYAQDFNRMYSRVGHLFQGRFKSFVIEKEAYLLNVARYVVLNPVRAGLVKRPEDWAWSSYNETVGSRTPWFSTVDYILNYFSSDDAIAKKAYAKFVYAGIGLASPFADIEGERILGTPQFVNEVRDNFDTKKKVTEIPLIQRYPNRPSLEDIFVKPYDRSGWWAGIRLARLHCGYSFTEIAGFLQLTRGRISQIFHQN